MALTLASARGLRISYRAGGLNGRTAQRGGSTGSPADWKWPVTIRVYFVGGGCNRRRFHKTHKTELLPSISRTRERDAQAGGGNASRGYNTTLEKRLAKRSGNGTQVKWKVLLLRKLQKSERCVKARHVPITIHGGWVSWPSQAQRLGFFLILFLIKWVKRRFESVLFLIAFSSPFQTFPPLSFSSHSSLSVVAFPLLMTSSHFLNFRYIVICFVHILQSSPSNIGIVISHLRAILSSLFSNVPLCSKSFSRLIFSVATSSVLSVPSCSNSFFLFFHYRIPLIFLRVDE